MKTVLPLLKKYGKTLLVILILGAGTYFHVDVTKFVSGLTDTVSAPAVAPAAEGPDSGVAE
jgi:hypothetical protein